MRVSDPEIKVVTYAEANTFYILVHIMRNLQYRNIYDKNLRVWKNVIIKSDFMDFLGDF